MHVSYRFHSEIPKKGNVWKPQERGGRYSWESLQDGRCNDYQGCDIGTGAALFEKQPVSMDADDGISGTNTKKRDEFNRLIDDCMAGKIDLVVTKSISRFARNTLDCLNYIRQLKDKNITVFFEKEYIQNGGNP